MATCIVPGVCVGQSIIHAIDTTLSIHANLDIDSINSAYSTQLDSIRSELDSVAQISNRQLNRIQAMTNELKNKFDTIRFVQKIDSVLHWKNDRLKRIAQRSDSIRLAINKKLDGLPLPVALRDKVQQLNSGMAALQAPLGQDLQTNFGSLAKLSPDVSQSLGKITSIGSELNNVASLGKVDVPPGVEMSSLSALEKQVTSVSPVNNGGKINADKLTSVAEQQLSNNSTISSVSGQIGESSQLTSMIGKTGDEDAMKQQLLQQVQEQATDHFKGKSEQLNNAISAIARHKAKIPSVTSLNEIPRRVPNEMKGKPLIERLVPGVAFQVLKSDDLFTMDFNGYVGYRFTKRLTIGGGWNERVGLNAKPLTLTSGNVRIFGPRLFGSFKLSRGFEPRIEFEAMNTFIPPYIRNPGIDPGSRRWVCGAFAGISKTYNITKRIRGTATIMLRLFDPNRTSPYPDVINARFGVEVPLKKRIRKQRH